jgi:FMN reductase
MMHPSPERPFWIGEWKMEARLKVAGIGGSTARPSRSLAALRIALEAARNAGADVELFDIRALELPLYAPDVAPVPEAAQRMAEAVCEAKGLLWSSPLYHGTISGAFKNALDWLHLLSDRDPPYLSYKVVGLISTAGGVQGLQAVNTMEFVVRALRGWAVPLVMPISRAAQVFDESGRALDALVEGQLHSLGREVVRAARQFAELGYCDYS